MKRAFLTGITGQDGSYLAELLLKKGYEVHGLVRRSSSFNTGRIDHIFRDRHEKDARLFIHLGDLDDSSRLSRLLGEIRPNEIYHLGAMSHVATSFHIPEHTANVTGLGTVRLLDAIRETRIKTRFYQASSSELFGNAPEFPQNEETPFHPRSPYAYSKLLAYWAAVNCREAYGIFACNGILFNHESPRRGETFVTRKITRAIGRILAGEQKKIYLGNLDAKRDWGYAKDYVEAMWLMLQAKRPRDYVIATGEAHSVRDFLDEAFRLVGLDPKKHIRFSEEYLRPTEVDHLVGDPSKARRELGWKPKTSFLKLVRLMVESDIRLAGLDPKKFMKG